MQRHWRAAMDLRAFATAASDQVPEDARTVAFADWVDFVGRYADAIDPILTPERTLKMLERPNTSLWLSDEDLGQAKRRLSWKYLH
jgi:hypothetical protein